MKDAISTEGRIFAKQILREVKAREVSELSIATLLNKLHVEGSPVRRAALLKEGAKLFAGWPALWADFTTSRHSATFDTISMVSGDHTFVAMEGEEQGLIAQRHTFHTTRKGCQAVVGVVVCNISSHALGRLYDRCDGFPTAKQGVTLALMCARLGAMCAVDGRLAQSNMSLAMYGAILSGSMKVGRHYGPDAIVSPFWDVRTALGVEMVDGEHLAQASAAAKALMAITCDTSGIPFIERHHDYVLQLAEAARKPQ